MTQPVSAGHIVATRYSLVSLLGASDLAEVYRALDGARPCVVKLLSLQLGQLHEGLHAFQEAATSAAALRTSVIVPATDFGFDPSSGRPFVATEHVELPSLSTLVRTRGPLPLSLFGEALQVIVSALEAGIGIQLAHGSLKPQNLFLSPERPSIAKVSDFGISRLRFVCPPPHGPASLGWSSPEQQTGAPPSLAGDVFSLGLSTFYALVGRHYLRAMWQSDPNTSQVLRELTEPHPSASEHARALGGELPAALDAWFAQTFSLDPKQRFADARECVRAFGEVAASLRRVSQKSPTPPFGIAAAVAAPLVFQELPRTASAHDGVVPQAPSLFGAASSRSNTPSQPPASGSKHPNPEHVAGLPSRPPLGLLTAVGLGLIAILAVAGWGVSRIFRSNEPAAAGASGVPISPAPKPLLSVPQLGSSAPSPSPEPKTRADFRCSPVACEWIVCDGQNVPKGVLSLALAPGRHVCSGSRYGFRTAVIEFTLEDGTAKGIEFELLPARGSASALPVKSAQNASVTAKPLLKAATSPTKSATNTISNSKSSSLATAKKSSALSAAATAKTSTKSSATTAKPTATSTKAKSSSKPKTKRKAQ